MNTCWAPNIETSLKRFTLATIPRYFLLPSRPTGLHSHLTLNEWLHVVSTARFEYPPRWLQHCFVVTQVVPRETADVSVHVLCTPYNHAPVYNVIFLRSHICRVHVCLSVTRHLHFWKNGRDLLHSTALTRGWTDTEIRVSTKSWLRRKQILPPQLNSCRESNPRPFDYESGALPLKWLVTHFVHSNLTSNILHSVTCILMCILNHRYAKVGMIPSQPTLYPNL